MKQQGNGRPARLAILILVQLAIASAAPFAAAHLSGYFRVLAVKLIYAVSFLFPYACWRYALRPIRDPGEKHLYCEYKRPAFFVAFAAIVAALQINVVLLEAVGYRGGTGTGPFDGFFGILFSFLMFVAVPVVSEELFFRVALQRFAGDGLHAALFCGVMFGLCHFNLPQLFYCVVSGVVLSLLVLYTEDVRLAFWLHFAVNSSVLVLSYLSRWLPAGWYVAIETLLWLSVLAAGVYYARVLLRDHQGQMARRREQIRRNRADLTLGEIVSGPMLICGGFILLAFILRCL